MPFPGTRPAAPAPAAGPAPQTQAPSRAGWGRPANLPAAPQGASGPGPATPGWGNRQSGGQPGGTRSPFAGIQQASVSRRGNYIEEGDYVLKVKEVIYKPGRNDNFMIIETDVIISSYDPADPATAGCNREGTSASIFIKENDSFQSNVKAFIIAASGFDAQGHPRPIDDVVEQSEADAAVGPQQPFAGVYIYVEARTRQARSGNPFTNLNYWPVPLTPQGEPDMARFSKD